MKDQTLKKLKVVEENVGKHTCNLAGDKRLHYTSIHKAKLGNIKIKQSKNISNRLRKKFDKL